MTWWSALYDDLLADVLLERADPTETTDTLDFLERRLRLRPGDRVFDQCCGIGSLAVPLAARGFEVVGVDQAADYVRRGEADAAAAGVSVQLVAGDAFEHVPAPRCKAAFNWWTSFGYAETDAENQRMLDRAFEALEPGGRFALDSMNVPGVLRAFRPTVTTTRATPRGEVELTRTSEVDVLAGVMRKRWAYRVPGGDVVEHESTVRLYAPDRLADLLGAAGFVDVQGFGQIDGRPLELDSPRAILVAQRPG